ncbi:MAG TPA: beta-eliminating lyase-related protein [Gaiellaceae bacterium]|nr:beta-eliminating lyase-related protein [Gaiellaceae bacterium]
MTERERERIVARCERFVNAWNAPRDPAETFRALADRAGPRLDVYGGGESVERLESRVAGMLGKEAAVLFPSGTMAQQVALRILCDRGRCSTIGFHPQCHLDVHEERGYEHLHGLHARPIGNRDRLIARADLDEVGEPLGALLLELPQRDIGGQLPAWRELRAQATWARRHGVALHLDGARLWQCGPFYRRPLREIAALFDTVYVSLYKDLGGLGGCILAGAEDVIAEARVWRVRHGGRLSTYEPMALSAERGLDEVLPRMPAFVRKAREIGAALARVDGVDVVPDPPQAAMLHVHVRGELERLRDTLYEIAKERRTLIAGYFAPTAVERRQKTELTIGAPSLEVPTGEIAELYAELVERAGKRRRSARATQRK